MDLCKQLVAELEPAPADGALILAAALARAGRHQEAVASLLESNKNPEPLTLLTAAQILLAAGEVDFLIKCRMNVFITRTITGEVVN